MAKKITLKNKNGDVLCPHTAIEQVQGLKEALDDKLGKTEDVASAGSLTPLTLDHADVTSDAGLTVYQLWTGDEGTDILPNGSMMLNMATNDGVKKQLLFGHQVGSNNNMVIQYRRKTGSWSDWKTVAFTDSTVASVIDGSISTSKIADAAITPVKIQTSIALNGTPSMTVEPTTSSPDKTIASVGLVKEAVDGIEIGGTNHLRYLKDDGSSYWDGGSGVTCDVTIDGDVIKGQTNGNNNPRIYNSSTKEIVWEPNTDYVLSYYAKGQGDYSALIIIEGNNVNFCPFSDMGVYSSEWKKYVKKFTTPSDIIDANTQLLKFYCGHRNANDTTSWLEIKDIKIERGNKATDWSPAPEDVQKQLNDTVNDKLEGYASIQYVNNKVASIGTPGNATETGAGIVRAATQVEVAAGHVSDNDPAEMAFVRPETLQSKLSNYPTTTAMTQAINESRQIIYYQSSQPSGGKNGDIWIKP